MWTDKVIGMDGSGGYVHARKSLVQGVGSQNKFGRARRDTDGTHDAGSRNGHRESKNSKSQLFDRGK